MSGIRNGQTSDEIDRLKSQKRFLVEKIKTEVRSGIQVILNVFIDLFFINLFFRMKTESSYYLKVKSC